MTEDNDRLTNWLARAITGATDTDVDTSHITTTPHVGLETDPIDLYLNPETLEFLHMNLHPGGKAYLGRIEMETEFGTIVMEPEGGKIVLQYKDGENHD